MHRQVKAFPLRVLHVYSVLGVGGAETWLLALLRHLCHTGASIQVDVCLTGEERGVLEPEAEALGARLIRIPFRRGALGAFAQQFRALLAHGRYDAVHDHQDFVSGLHLLAGVGVLPPIRVVHVHNPLSHIERYQDGGRLRRATLWAGQHLVARLATHVAGTSQQILDEYGFGEPRYAHLWRGPAYCGFDVDAFRTPHSAHVRAGVRAEWGWDADAPLVLFAGRLDSHPDPARNQKNPRFALDVARALLARHPEARMIMAGDGEAVRRQLEDLVQGWGLADRIRLVGRRSDVPRLMQAADALLFPSLAEGLGMVAVEAQAAGLPVLASTDVPCEAAVADGLMTFLPLDAGAARWAERLQDIFDRPRPDAAVAADAVAASPFEIGRSVDRLVAMYRGLDPETAETLLHAPPMPR